MLFWLGAIASAYLGYRLLDWWVPAVVACAVVALQLVMFQLVLGGGRATSAELYAFSLFLNLLVYYATFGIGRSLGQRLKQRGKGAR